MTGDEKLAFAKEEALRKLRFFQTSEINDAEEKLIDLRAKPQKQVKQ